jgi:hypothetical protein
VSESSIAPSANDGSWQSCATTAGAMIYTLVGPVLQGNHDIYVYAKDLAGNISASSTVSLIYDTTNPALNLSTVLGTLYKSGDSISLSFTTSDTNGLSALRIDYAPDGTTFSLVANLATNASTYNWTVPASNTTTAKIRLVASDSAISANATTVESGFFTIDSTAPVAPSLTRVSSAISNSSTVTMTVGSCTDTSHILISESSTAPSAIDAGWIACSTGAGDFSATVTGEALHTLYAWAKDSAGNVATSANNISMSYDTTAPLITPTTPAALKGNVSTGTVSWTLTETNVVAATNFTIELFNGSTWLSVGTIAANVGINTAQSYSLTNFTVPNVDVITAKFRVTLVDGAGLSTTTESGVFTIDSTAPVLSSVSINSGAAYAGTSLLSLNIDLADNLSSSSLFVKLAMANSGTSDCQSEYVNSGWQAWTSSLQNFTFTIAPVDGIKKVCVWAKDAVGNVSVMSPTAGTDGVNEDTILFQVGNPPQITSITATNTSNGSTTYTLGNPVTINWAASDAEGLDDNPIALSYSTNNTTWYDVVTGLDSSVSENVTWMGSLSGNPTTASGTYTAFNAPSSGYFIIKVIAKDTAGNISIVAQSQPQNTSQWSVFAGTGDRGDGGSGNTAALYSTAGGTGLTFAINPLTNDIYTIDDLVGIRKLNVQTGKVSTFISYGTLNFPANGTLDSTHRFPVNSHTRMKVNSSGIMYLMSNGSTALVYKINLATNQVSFYIGGGSDNSTSATASTIMVSSGILDVDASENLYFMTDCNPVPASPTVAKKLMMVSQNPDGTPGSFTHLAGNCAVGTFTSGQPATSQPFNLANFAYGVLSSVAAVNPNLIYLSAYNGSVYF